MKMSAFEETLIGKRVRLIRCNDEYTSLKAGDEGVVNCVDDIGTVFVTWDSGSNLGLVRKAGDLFTVIG